MGSLRDQVHVLQFRRKEYLRQKNSGVSKVNDKEKVLMKSLQSVL